MNDKTAKNTDREIWRKTDGDAYAPSIHVTESGNIGINVGGTVNVMPVERWHSLASRTSPEPGEWQVETVAERIYNADFRVGQWAEWSEIDENEPANKRLKDQYRAYARAASIPTQPEGSALRSSGAVKVKALEWRPIGPEGSDVEADTSIGIYTMSFDAPTAGGAVSLWTPGDDADTFTVHENRKSAKAAAQADYERRIRSALTPASNNGGEVTDAARAGRGIAPHSGRTQGRGMTMATEHKLKTWPRYWDAIDSGEKTFEVRLNDRAFQTGDILLLEQYNPETRRYVTEGFAIDAKIKTIRKRVTFLLQGGQFGIEPGHCVLGLGDADQ